MLLETVFQLQISAHYDEIENIKADKAFYDSKAKKLQPFNQFKTHLVTSKSLQLKDIEKERAKIEELEDLKSKLLSDDNTLLVVSKDITLHFNIIAGGKFGISLGS